MAGANFAFEKELLQIIHYNLHKIAGANFAFKKELLQIIYYNLHKMAGANFAFRKAAPLINKKTKLLNH